MFHSLVCRAAIGLAACGMLIPSGVSWAVEPAAASTTAVEAPIITDVALAPGGILLGQVVDSAGVGQPGQSLVVRQGEAIAASTVTGAEGKFAIRGLQGGVFQVSAGQGVGIYRLWAPETAPPAAARSAMVVSDATAVRGQTTRAGQFLANPLVIAGVVAVAVAVPVAVHQYRKDHKSGS